MITRCDFDKAKEIEFEIEELKTMLHNLSFKTTFDSRLESVSHYELIEHMKNMLEVKLDQFKLIVSDEV